MGKCFFSYLFKLLGLTFQRKKRKEFRFKLFYGITALNVKISYIKGLSAKHYTPQNLLWKYGLKMAASTKLSVEICADVTIEKGVRVLYFKSKDKKCNITLNS